MAAGGGRRWKERTTEGTARELAVELTGQGRRRATSKRLP